MSYTNGGLTRKLAARLSSKGDTPPQFLFNAFDDVAREALPGLSTYWDSFPRPSARGRFTCAGQDPPSTLPSPRSTTLPPSSFSSSTATAGMSHLVSMVGRGEESSILRHD